MPKKTGIIKEGIIFHKFSVLNSGASSGDFRKFLEKLYLLSQHSLDFQSFWYLSLGMPIFAIIRINACLKVKVVILFSLKLNGQVVWDNKVFDARMCSGSETTWLKANAFFSKRIEGGRACVAPLWVEGGECSFCVTLKQTTTTRYLRRWGWGFFRLNLL